MKIKIFKIKAKQFLLIQRFLEPNGRLINMWVASILACIAMLNLCANGGPKIMEDGGVGY